jgi:1,4-alpha-glucan branching enzyme
MYEQFGAVVDGDAVTFKLFIPDNTKDPGQYERGGLPNLASVQVIGDFHGDPWDAAAAPVMTAADHQGKGTLYSHRVSGLPDGFYQYKYLVTYLDGESRWCGDPCAKYLAGGVYENAGFVIGGHIDTVRPIAERRPIQDLVIYELMLDDFTAPYRDTRAPVDAMLDKLPYLRELGVNAVEFMPWTPWPGGEFSWGYDPFQFFAVENRYIEDPADPLDRLYRFKRLINTLHDAGIQVIMDGVFNHVLPTFAYHDLYQNREDSPYTGNFAGGAYFQDLDYQNQCTLDYVVDACKYWLDVYKVDGIRLDYTLGFYDEANPQRGLGRLIGELRAHLARPEGQNVALMLEHMSDNRYDAINVCIRVDADGCWYDRFLWDTVGQASTGNIGTDLMRVLQTSRDFAPGKVAVTYIENHDHSTAVSRVGGRGRWWKVQPPLIAVMTVPGAVLIHNGQEFGDDYWLPEDGPDRVVPRSLHWDLADDEVGRHLRWLHGHLLDIRARYPALRSPNLYPVEHHEEWQCFNPEGHGVCVHKDVVIYHRWGQAEDNALERFTVVINFSDYDQWVDIPLPVNGAWNDLLGAQAYQAADWCLANHRVPSNWGRVLYFRG